MKNYNSRKRHPFFFDDGDTEIVTTTTHDSISIPFQFVLNLIALQTKLQPYKRIKT